MSDSDHHSIAAQPPGEVVNLTIIQAELRRWAESMAVPGSPPGTYRFTPGGEPRFYASADMAILRWIIGDDLKEGLGSRERAAWIDVINGYQNPHDGRYGPEMNHHILHANGTAVKALTMLGGRHRHRVAFYRLFNRADSIGPWLTSLSWAYNPWSISHLPWGGVGPLNNSSRVTPEWRNALFSWCDDQLDPNTGSWPKDFPVAHPPASENPLMPLGCAVHLWPLWRHRGLPVPGVSRLAELVLGWQTPEGYWGGLLHGTGIHYGSMDALYVLMVAAEQEPEHAERYRAALARFLPLLLEDLSGPRLSFRDAHAALCWASCLGYLTRALPERFNGDIRWGDIFDRKEIYDLDAVHPFPLDGEMER